MTVTIVKQLSDEDGNLYFKMTVTFFHVYKLMICHFILQLQNYTEHCAACSAQTQTARVYQNADSSPSKHEDSTQCCFNVGPAPLAVGQ